MKLLEHAKQFGIVFIVCLIVTAIVTFLYSLAVHGAGVIDWETSFRFAIVLGIVLPWMNRREKKM